ncbi:hypothetical protein [Chitinilyticum litopenaei]|uniref:hypothetical protein n=1 Tax=Chitinilyticum litopenaei TaxID=1121276 RepID=UPI0004249FA0|nr:hypothetical protein [Chitinilyticum litopenaei]
MSHDERRTLHSDGLGAFQPHGKVEVWATGQILHYRATGPFNLEFLIALDAADRELMASVAARGPFAILAQFTGSIAGTPEALAALESSLAEQNRLGLASLAVAFVVGPEVEGRVLMKRIFAGIYARQGLRFQWFEEAEAAQAWLAESLSHADNPPPSP